MLRHLCLSSSPAHDVDEVDKKDTIEDLFHDDDFVGEYDSSVKMKRLLSEM